MPAGRGARVAGQAETEQRWRQRFSAAADDALRRPLSTLTTAVAGDLPDCPPILGHGLWSTRESPPLAGVRVGTGPVRTGVAEAGLAMAVGWLERRAGRERAGCRRRARAPDPAHGAGHGPRARLPGASGWGRARLPGALERMVGDGTAAGSPLWTGLVPYPDGWRPGVPRPATLPHFPLVLHGGRFPDGSRPG